MLYISQSDSYTLSDFSALYLKAREEGAYLYGNEKSYNFSFEASTACPNKLSADQLVGIFSRFTTNATACDETAEKAIGLLRERISNSYYSGICGKIRSVFNYLFGWFSFDRHLLSKSLEGVKTEISTLDQLKRVSQPTPLEGVEGTTIFSGDLTQLEEHAWKHYNLFWVTPDDYLSTLAPDFYLHPGEQKMPLIVEEIRAIYRGEKETLLHPLVVDHYTYPDTSILKDKEKVLAAKWLGIPKIPIAFIPEPQRPKALKEVNSTTIFSGNLKDQKTISWIGSYGYEPYNIEWMAPTTYLHRVDPHFSCQPAQESMPWIIYKMQRLASGEETTKFAPLMMKPHEKYEISPGYTILGHEGRHRALAASWLGISPIPVAVLQKKTDNYT
ncbi:MAG: hypothetical protein S4CHLAM45_04070 [Chlamydiales bacterium]|nr:hypothetical protein [Chlamydiales bacterium]MCH9619261.1 hypothetical protein [Chlamydiales bacterium]MCH9622523.1 hypothetical protein [Chlamydiales bacterium]